MKDINNQYNQRIVKILCPHCSYLCSPQMTHCTKCGETLPHDPKILRSNSKFSISKSYPYKNKVLKSIEQRINKLIPLKNELKQNDIGYIESNGEITDLSLFKCHLEHFPEEILKLTSLRILMLRRNIITQLPSNIAFLSNLNLLDLRINKIEYLPKSIGFMTNLKYLNISSNIMKSLPSSIGNLKSLEYINLSNNRLLSIPESIGNLTSLKELNLKANFWIKIPKAVKNLEKKGLQIIL